MKSCPACAEQIQEAAIKCRFCGEPLQANQALEPADETLPTRSRLAFWARCLGCIPFIALVLLGIFAGSLNLMLASAGCGVAFFFGAYIAWDLGDRFRMFAMPSFYTANGAVDLAKKKLFWMYGPQFGGVWILFLTAIIPTSLAFESAIESKHRAEPTVTEQHRNDMPDVTPEAGPAMVAEEPAEEAAPVTEDYLERCTSTAPEQQSEYLACLQGQFAEADQALNARYKEKMQRLDHAQKEALRAEERLWVKSKTSYCQSSATDVDSQISQTTCDLKMTMSRLQDLAQ